MAVMSTKERLGVDRTEAWTGEAGVVLAPRQVTVPVPGLPVPTRQLRRRHVALPYPSDMPTWWVGVHGGAGESTLAALSTEWSKPADHAWPTGLADPCPVVLVARTSHAGLLAAQAAVTSWASGWAEVDLVGLVLSADAPGRLPRPLRDLADKVAGGVLTRPVWHLPWIEEWRFGVTTDPPGPVRSLLADVRKHTAPTH